ncbi:helix-turn-helix domain-containing protein [Enterococcus sp. BWM-S5]|uniref:Helix-turn-helix domain-containing protein n=1 Tax=Enterococcus larvae TaxID=2794352 RepID=A0ABS4CN56_9ENTE|nr:helix-turn-helix domain-containing protein [Enterococcus larvae]MBP1047633.1 helix-turn-helix domain-containing protein [Enterococcus larvae]
MIYTYIEKGLLRAVELVDLLLGEQYISSTSISTNLSCTPVTITNDINYLRSTLHITILENEAGDYRIDPFTEGNRDTISKKIYAESLFLKAVAYFLKPAEKKYIDFIDEQYISVSKGYLLRATVEKFLNELELTISDNQITGNIIKIRFLASILTRQFGLNLINTDEEITIKSLDVLKVIEQNLNITFSNSEKSFFDSLLQTTVASNIPQGSLHFPAVALETINKYLRPKDFDKVLKSNFASIWGERFEDEYLFTALSLMVINTHVFDQKMDPETLAAYRENFLSDPSVKRLTDLFEEAFSTDLISKDWFLSAIFTFLKDTTLDLHPLISTEYLRIDKADSEFFTKVKQVIQEWNIYGLNITEKHINVLCCRLNPFIIKKQVSTIALISENSIDSHITQMMIKDFLPQTIRFTIHSDLAAAEKNTDSLDKTLFVIDKNASLPKKCDPSVRSLFIDFPPGTTDLKKILSCTFL